MYARFLGENKIQYGHLFLDPFGCSATGISKQKLSRSLSYRMKLSVELYINLVHSRLINISHR